MRRIVLIAILLGISMAGPVGATDRPSTQPTTQPVTGSVSGRVSVMGGLFQKPDLSRVIVFLGDDPKLSAASKPPGRTFVAQHNKEFHPNFVVIERNTTVEFPNWDHFEHNVFSRSAAAPAFDLERYPYGQSKSRVFSKLGVVQLFCNIHPQMRAVIYVTPNSFFTRCDPDGNFRIDNIPPGHFEIVAWQERCGEQHKAIEITLAHTVNVSLELGQTHDRILRSDDPDRRASYGVARGLSVKRHVLGLPVVSGTHPAPPESKPK